MQVFDSQHMRPRQIGHMNIIADAGSVTGIIIRTEHHKLLPPAGRGIHNNRQQILRTDFPASDAPFCIITDRIKITQCQITEIFQPAVPLHVLFNVIFGKTVKINRPERMFFVNRQIFRHSVNRRRRRKNHIFHTVFQHRLHNVQRTGNIVFGIKFRFFHRFADGFFGGQMHHRFLSGHCFVQRRKVKDIGFDKSRFGKQIDFLSAGKIIINRNTVPALQQRLNDMAADISGAADDQNLNHQRLLISCRCRNSQNRPPEPHPHPAYCANPKSCGFSSCCEFYSDPRF